MLGLCSWKSQQKHTTAYFPPHQNYFKCSSSWLFLKCSSSWLFVILPAAIQNINLSPSNIHQIFNHWNLWMLKWNVVGSNVKWGLPVLPKNISTCSTITSERHKPLLFITVKILVLVVISLPFLQSVFTQHASCSPQNSKGGAGLAHRYCLQLLCRCQMSLHHHNHCKMIPGQHLLYSLKLVPSWRGMLACLPLYYAHVSKVTLPPPVMWHHVLSCRVMTVTR
jgi:hypothetical protein